MVKWKNGLPGFPEYDAYKLACRIEQCYEKNKASIKIKKSGAIPFCGDGYKFEINLEKSDTSVGKIEKLAQDVQFMLKLPCFKAVRENGALYLVTSTPNTQTLNNDLFYVFGTEAYDTAFKNLELAHPVGVSQDGQIMICDLKEYPHALVSGASQSGKSTALKCMTISLLKYAPSKLNFLIADKGITFSEFSDLPHLSCPIVYLPDDLAAVFLVLNDEMEKRIALLREDKETFSKLPYIICMVDEFSWFIKRISRNKKTENIVEIINDILRFGRNVKIHLVLAIYDPKDDIAIIEKGDLRVSLAFQTANAQKSRNVLDGTGAEKLKGAGDMIFRHNGRTDHLQGVNISEEEIDEVVEAVKQNKFDIEFPRGIYGFSVSSEDIKAKKMEMDRLPYASPVGRGINNKNSEDENAAFCRVVVWVLSQPSVSINLIQNSGLVPKSYSVANRIHQELCRYGLLGEKNSNGRQIVLPLSLESLSKELKEMLNRNGYSDDDIKVAINKRIEL